jgi:hypothetical protein
MLFEEKDDEFVLACSHFQSCLQVLIELFQSGISQVRESEDRKLMLMGYDTQAGLAEAACCTCKQEGTTLSYLSLNRTHQMNHFIH